MHTAKPFVAIGVLVVVQALTLYAFGQPAICDCGVVKLWEGVVTSTGMSQHMTDWYTFSHIIHGFIFFYLLRYIFPNKTLLWRLAIAVGFEAAWEIAENTPALIEHYQQQALASGYVGDSILNSLMDTVAMLSGFLFASRNRVAIVVGIALAMEVFTLVLIRDNLTLNIVNLIHVVPGINEWQSGAH